MTGRSSKAQFVQAFKKKGSIVHTEYEYLATGRRTSLLAQDIEDNLRLLQERVTNSRVAIIGAAGSIGSSVVKGILRFSPAGLALIDINENNLVEVVRDCRSSPDIIVPDDFTVLPIGLGSVEFMRFFKESKPFDYVLNLSAVKHVRSEKNVYCLIRMIDTNVCYPAEFLEGLQYRLKKFFSVSSDKATNPVNLMGASKMAMEAVLLCQHEQPFSTARFANVAFSDGSLPYGFLKRIAKRQPVAAPRDVRRYFISHEEAGQICLLSSMLGENGDVYFPKLEERVDEKTFSEIAVRLIEHLGYEAYECSDEDEAKQKLNELLADKKWPCFFFDSDTTGEKDREEFYGADETLDLDRYRRIGVIKHSAKNVNEKVVAEFLQFVHKARSDSSVAKPDYVRAFEKVVPTLKHLETGKNLDQKM